MAKCPFMGSKKNYSQFSQTHTPLSQCEMVAKECLEDKCALWVKLKNGNQEQGRCAIAWSTILLVEFRQAIERRIQR